MKRTPATPLLFGPVTPYFLDYPVDFACRTPGVQKMALPKSYLTTIKNLAGIMNSIVGGQAPKKFTTRFLESLGYKASGDRLMIGVLKSLGFLTDDGQPLQRYHEYLDQTRSAVVLAQGIEEAYGDLFQVNKNADKMSKSEVLNKLKTLSQGQYSDVVLGKMAMTFVALCGLADFTAQKNCLTKWSTTCKMAMTLGRGPIRTMVRTTPVNGYR